MKRFYCTICKRTKRVRKYPVIIENSTSDSPENRKGICNWHTAAGKQILRKVAR